MMDFNVSIHTTVLLVDDDLQQLELRALVMTMSGFTVLSASNALDAISILAQRAEGAPDVAILDYEMPGVNGCVLAGYIRARYPEMKIVLHSGAVEIPESEMSSVDRFVSKGDGVGRLLEEVSYLARFRGQQGIMGETVAAVYADLFA
jgi:CheY-like chemotaxis protein